MLSDPARQTSVSPPRSICVLVPAYPSACYREALISSISSKTEVEWVIAFQRTDSRLIASLTPLAARIVRLSISQALRWGAAANVAARFSNAAFLDFFQMGNTAYPTESAVTREEFFTLGGFLPAEEYEARSELKRRLRRRRSFIGRRLDRALRKKRSPSLSLMPRIDLRFESGTVAVPFDAEQHVVTRNFNDDFPFQRLYVVPRSGLCNRLRAIASARRICADRNARCTIVWDWGSFETLFEVPPDCDVMDAGEFRRLRGVQYFRHPNVKEGRVSVNGLRPGLHAIPGRVGREIAVFSHSIFGCVGGRQPGLGDLRPWFCRANSEVRARASEYVARTFSAPVGVHIRRGDHVDCIAASPLPLFVAECERIVDEGRSVFLATDCARTATKIKKKFGGAILTYPKAELPQRWPRRSFDREATLDDLIELELLAACDYVLGSPHSSYSAHAMCVNASPLNRIVRVP